MAAPELELSLIFLDKSLLYVAKVVVLQSCELHKLLRPNRKDIAMLSTSRRHAASDQILIGVHQLVILETEEHEVVEILLDQGHCFLAGLHLPQLPSNFHLVCGVQDSISHEDFCDVVEDGVGVQVKFNRIEDLLLLFA